MIKNNKIFLFIITLFLSLNQTINSGIIDFIKKNPKTFTASLILTGAVYIYLKQSKSLPESLFGQTIKKYRLDKNDLQAFCINENNFESADFQDGALHIKSNNGKHVKIIFEKIGRGIKQIFKQISGHQSGQISYDEYTVTKNI